MSPADQQRRLDARIYRALPATVTGALRLLTEWAAEHPSNVLVMFRGSRSSPSVRVRLRGELPDNVAFAFALAGFRREARYGKPYWTTEPFKPRAKPVRKAAKAAALECAIEGF